MIFPQQVTSFSFKEATLTANHHLRAKNEVSKFETWQDNGLT